MAQEAMDLVAHQDLSISQHAANTSLRNNWNPCRPIYHFSPFQCTLQTKCRTGVDSLSVQLPSTFFWVSHGVARLGHHSSPLSRFFLRRHSPVPNIHEDMVRLMHVFACLRMSSHVFKNGLLINEMLFSGYISRRSLRLWRVIPRQGTPP